MTYYTNLLFFTLLLISSISYSNENVIHVYHDADRSNHVESAYSIEQGIKTALSEINNEIQGYKINFIPLDHRGNVSRSKRNYKTFLNDANALAIFSGIHSPPLIKNRTYINDNKALTLVPWAAASPITRSENKENWIFRLSIDDSTAGNTISKFATETLACKKPHLLLEDSPWGDSNLKTMSQYMESNNILITGITRFDWNLMIAGARIKLRDVLKRETDCILLVANAIEGETISRAMLAMPEDKRIPIVSHWGITGGNFHEKITADLRKDLGLYFIQTCFSFLQEPLKPFAQSVFDQAKSLFPDTINTTTDILSPVGFIHAYDLTRLLIAALNQIKLGSDSLANREKLRLALEDIQTPVSGLIKTYESPYSTYDPNTAKDAHEALSNKNYCMAKYGDNNEILLID